MPRGDELHPDHSQKVKFSDRKAEIHCTSSDSSSFADQVSPTGPGLCSKPETELRIFDKNPQRGKGRTAVVDRKSTITGRDPSTYSSSGPSDILGCCPLERPFKGVGGSVSFRFHGGTLVRGGEKAGHKHSGASGSRVGHKNFHEGSETQVDPHEDRQHNGSLVFSEAGRYKKLGSDSDNQENMGISLATQDHAYCRVDTLQGKCGGGLGIQECGRSSRMETIPFHVQENLSEERSTNSRSFRFPSVSSTRPVLQLQNGPSLSSNRCIQTGLEPRHSICFPPILPYSKSVTTDRESKRGEIDFNRSSMALSTMVSPASVNDNRYSSSSSQVTRPPSKPERGLPSSIVERYTDASGVRHIRDKLQEAGVSEDAVELILNARREGTTKNYESAWSKWSLWCNSRGMDPFGAPLNIVLNYLSFLHNMNYKYRTIGVARSAISAYHDLVDGFRVGRHPNTIALMDGVANVNPPHAKHSCTWDVELVLSLFRSWPEKLSAKQLSQKLAILLGLIALKRGAEIHQLDISFKKSFGDYYSFDLQKTVKNIKGKVPKPLKFFRHGGNKKLCPMYCIDQYITMTNPWRPKQNHGPLFLSYVKPHLPLSKSRLAAWVKEIIKQAGVNTDTFSAHSVRGASSSKAFMEGLSIQEVLDHGSWSQESTWQRFYHREVDSTARRYQRKLLGL